MKRTLIAIFALGSMTMAITEQEAQDLLTKATIGNSTSVTSTTTPTDVTFIGIVDMQAFTTFRNSVSSSNRPIILTLTNSQDDQMSIRLGETNTAGNTLFRPSLKQHDWEDYTDRSSWTTASGFLNAKDGMATITFGYGATTGTDIVFSYVNAEGVVVENALTDSGMHYSNKTVKDVNYSELFSKVYLIEGKRLSTDEIHTVSQVALLGVTSVPEPATATLSLLALAGLCARRRRK